MSFDPLTAALDLGMIAINKLWPDPIDAARETLKIETLHQQGDLAGLQAQVSLLQGQQRINEKEASHPNIFIAGWRPFIGWTCGIALFYNYIIYNLLVWVLVLLKSTRAAPPPADMTELMPLLLAMLGIGAMRSYDKKQRTDTRGVSK